VFAFCGGNRVFLISFDYLVEKFFSLNLTPV